MTDTLAITLNGKPHRIGAGTTVAALLDEVAGAHRGSAIVLDGAVVPRSEWDDTVVAGGADVEVVTAVQGG